FVVYPPSLNATVYSADVSMPSSNVSIRTPCHTVSSFDHLVTQWMSTVTSSAGSARNSSHVQRRGSSTSPLTVKSHRSSAVYGVGPADKTGKSPVTYCPGGTRPAGASSRRPRKPREMIGGIIPTTLADHPSAPSPPRPPTPRPLSSAASRAGRTLSRRPALALPASPGNSLAPSGSPAPQHPAGKTRESWPKVRPAARNQIASRSQPQPRYPPEREPRAPGTPVPLRMLPTDSPPRRAWGAPGDQGPPNADPATAVPADRRALPGRPRQKTPLAPGAQALRGHGRLGH